MSLRMRVRRVFGNDAFDWPDRSYLIDWLVVTAFWILSEVAARLPVFERDFRLDDTLISHPHTKSQISGPTNHLIALIVPGALVLAGGIYRRSLFAVHHGVLALLAGRGLARVFTNALKNRIGRLRPDFLARCKWDAVESVCTGKHHDILDGRRSFPSGHSSAAFAGMTFLSFWLAGQLAAWCFHSPAASGSLRSSRLARFTLTLAPLCWAIFVAVTRLEDYRHHKEDVIAGGLIGILCASICYLVFWPSPFAAKSFSAAQIGQPRQLISAYELDRPTGDDFELSRLEDDMDV